MPSQIHSFPTLIFQNEPLGRQEVSDVDLVSLGSDNVRLLAFPSGLPSDICLSWQSLLDWFGLMEHDKYQTPNISVCLILEQPLGQVPDPLHWAASYSNNPGSQMWVQDTPGAAVGFEAGWKQVLRGSIRCLFQRLP